MASIKSGQQHFFLINPLYLVSPIRTKRKCKNDNLWFYRVNGANFLPKLDKKKKKICFTNALRFTNKHSVACKYKNNINKLMHFVLQIQNIPIKQIHIIFLFFLGPFCLYWIETVIVVKGGERAGMTCSNWIRTPGHCNKDSALVHGTPALLGELPGHPIHIILLLHNQICFTGRADPNASELRPLLWYLTSKSLFEC